jgi:hypothetical protein
MTEAPASTVATPPDTIKQSPDTPMAELRAILKQAGVSDDDPAVLFSKNLEWTLRAVERLPISTKAAADAEITRITAASAEITKKIELSIRSANTQISKEIATAAATAASEATKAGMKKALASRTQPSAALSQAVSAIALLIAVSLAYAAGTLASLGAPGSGLISVAWNEPAGPVVLIAALIAGGAYFADRYLGRVQS